MYRSGNVLFLILLAVALFAALSYAVTQAGRSGGKDISDEDARLQASALIQYATNISQAAMRMKLSKGLKWHEIEYAGDNTDCNSNDCQLFHAEGGGQILETPEVAVHHSNSATPIFRFIQIDGVGTDLPELAILIPGIATQTCAAVNKLMNVEENSLNDQGIPYAEPDLYPGGGVHQLNGASYSSSILRLTSEIDSERFRAWRIGDQASNQEASGKHALCICSASNCESGSEGWRRRFWHVIEAR